MNEYININDEYIQSIQSSISNFLFATKKWSYEDYLWPFSDFDYRIVLSCNQSVDYFEINENLYRIQLDMQHKSDQLRRILEHPPGYIFYKDEIYKEYLEDFRIWSYAGGNREEFLAFIQSLDKKPFFESAFYQKIINKRYKNFSLKTEYTDYSESDIYKYNIYCILWHYYFPCMFAIYSLHEKKSRGNKIQSECLQNAKINEIYQCLRGKSDKARIESFDYLETLKTIENVIDDTIDTSFLTNNSRQEMSLLEAIGMLRTRLARLKLYLEPDDIDRHYLAVREIIELKQIFQVLSKHISSTNNSIALDILNQDLSAEYKLQEILKHLYKNRPYYNLLMCNCYTERFE